MNGWNILSGIVSPLPSLVLALLLLALVIPLVAGFYRHGMNFIKYGFSQNAMAPSLEKRFGDLSEKMAAKDAAFEKRFDDLSEKMAAKDAAFEKRFDDLSEKMATKDDISRITANMAAKDDIARLDAKILAIETNHFGHLKNYLGILNGVLLDKKIIDNETKARLDNEVRGM